jgi:GDP-D-mannose dehydratase
MNPMKKALITGITGQDGAYLTELLLQKGYGFYRVSYLRFGKFTICDARFRF